MYEWVKGNVHNLMVTLYPTNITLNSSVASYFNDVRWVMIGIDREGKRIAIKPVTKREIDLHLVAMENLHKISIGKGYARISNKSIMDEIREIIKRDLTGLKLNASYNENENILEIDLHTR